MILLERQAYRAIGFWLLLLCFVASPQVSAQQDDADQQAKAGKQTFVSPAVQQQLDQVEEKLAEALHHYEEFSGNRSSESRRLPLGVHLLIILAAGIASVVLLRVLKIRLDKLLTKEGAIRESDTRLRAKTISQLIYWIGVVCVFASMAYMTLEALGVNLAPVLAGIGVLGLALGFGAQSLVRDVINGAFILLEDQYHVNDVIKVGELAGLVEQVNLRVTVLRNLEGQVIFIPNGEIKSVINLTKGWSRAVLDIGVAYKENVDHVIQVIKDVGAELKASPDFGKLMLEDLEIAGVDGFGDSQVTIRCLIKTVPIKQWQVAREFRRRLKNKFDELGIEIPFPHRSLYWGAGQLDELRELFGKAKTSDSR